MHQVTQRIIIAFLLIVVTALSLGSCFHQKKENTILKNVVEIKQDSTTYWKDKYGTEHANKLSADADLSSLKVAYRDLFDSIRSRLDIKDKDIQGITAIGAIATGKVSLTVDTIYIDSTREYKFRYSDKWLSLEGAVGNHSFVNYRLADSILFTTYRKRKGFFKRETYIDGYSLNPNVRVAGITGIRVVSKSDCRFSLGPYIGYGWNGSKWSPSAGISVHYSFFKF